MTKPRIAPESEFLATVTLRLIRAEERERFDQLLESSSKWAMESSV